MTPKDALYILQIHYILPNFVRFSVFNFIKLTEQNQFHSPNNLPSRFFGQALNKEIEPDEQLLQGTYPLEVQKV